jgi:hypothetical protein
MMDDRSRIALDKTRWSHLAILKVSGGMSFRGEQGFGVREVGWMSAEPVHHDGTVMNAAHGLDI